MHKLIAHITGKELMERWGMGGYKVWQIMKNVISSPENWESKKLLLGGSFNTQVEFARLIYADDTPKDLEDKIASFQFVLSEIENLENKFNLLPGKSSISDQNKVFPCDPGTKWKDVKITLTANDKVRIETPHSKGHFTYHELGMSDKRSGDRPGKLWKLLESFARSHGVVSFRSLKKEEDRKSLFSTAKRLNKHLKELFGINESIYKSPYNKHKRYDAKIFFSDQTIVVQPAANDDDSMLSIIKNEIEDKESTPSKNGKDNVYR